MIGMSRGELQASAKGSASKTSPTNSVIDQALALEGVTGRAADFIKSIYQQESSSGSNTKTSNRGAMGGMQIIPATFKTVANPDWDINNPIDNARAGVRYAMRQWNASRGDPVTAAAGYYGGDGGRLKAARGIAVNDPKNPDAPNTLEYGKQVAARMGSQPAQTPGSSNAPSGGQIAPTAARSPGVLASGARGLAQGATAGWSDELAGVGGAVGNAMNKTSMKPVDATALPIIGSTLSALMVLAGSKSKDESIADTYTRIRDTERTANADAREANPGSYMTTQILGTLLPAYLIKSPTALGAVAGAGNSDAVSVGGLAKDTATGAALGGLAGLGGSAVSGAVKKVGDKFGNKVIDDLINATEPTKGVLKSTVGGAATGATTGASGGALIALNTGQPDKIPEYAINGALSGAALGATSAGRNALGNKAVSELYKRTDNANIGSTIANSAPARAAGSATNAVAANAGTSDVAKEGTDNVLDWIKNVMGLDTPAGEQNLPASFRNKMEEDANAVKENLKDGRPSPDVPNIIKENGSEYLVTPSGRRVKLS